MRLVVEFSVKFTHVGIMPTYVIITIIIISELCVHAYEKIVIVNKLLFS